MYAMNVFQIHRPAGLQYTLECWLFVFIQNIIFYNMMTIKGHM